MKSPILVTGARGVIGTALVDELKSSGYDDVIGVSSIDADLQRESAAEDLFSAVRPNTVFHLAGRIFGIQGNISNKGVSYLQNVRINTNVVEAARLAGVQKFIAMGTTAVYGDEAPIPMTEESMWAGRPHKSEDSYAQAKRAMLSHLEAYNEQYGLDYAYAISTNLYGAHDRFDEKFGHVVPSLISRFQRGVAEGHRSLAIWGSGAPRRDFLYSKDAARALRLIGEQHTGAINLAGGSLVTIRQLVELLVDISGYGGEIVWDSSKPDGQMLREYELSKLRGIGFRPAYSLHDGLAETFRWYMENHRAARH